MRIRVTGASVLSIAAATLLTPGMAVAQSTTEAPQTSESASVDYGTIIVTARRKAESALDVPIAVTALAGDGLAAKGVDRVDDLQRVAPSISFRPTAGRRSNSQYEMRGINATESLITGDAPVGIYVDEVYRARATGTNQSFYDIDNVQLLYGPQGTLFGRNSSAGAVLINSKRPTQDFEGMVGAGYGNLNRFELTGMINVPLGDTLAIRLAGQRVTRDGYGVNVTSGNRLANINSWSGRASVLWEPTDGIRNTLIGSVYRANEAGSLVYLHGYRPCPSSTATVPAASCSTRSMPDVPVVDTRTIGQAVAQAWARRQTLGPWETALDATLKDYGTGGQNLTSDPRLISDPFENSRNYSLTNITEIELTSDITLKNILGYNKVQLIAATDLDGTPIKLVDTFYNTATTQISNELQLQGETGRLTWTVGGMYFRERGNDLQNSTQNVYTESRTNVVGINKSYAVFAQGTYKLTDQLSVTAGGRYTWDKRYVEYVEPFTYTLALDTLVRSTTPVCSVPAALDTDGDCIYQTNASFNEPTYTVSVDYKPSSNLLFYVAHRRGYRSGGLQARAALVATGPAVNGVIPTGSAPAFIPEVVKDVELGFKGDIGLGGDASISTNVALYKAWYTDVQRQITLLTGLSATTNPSGLPTTTAVVNVGDAVVQGFSFEGNLTLVRGFSIGGFFGLVDGTYTNFRTASATLSGIPFATSKYTAGVNVNLTPIDSPEAGRVTLDAGYNYRSRFTTDQSLPNLEPESFSPAQHNVNLSVTWDEIMGSQVTGQLWVRNATNEANPLGFTALAGSFGVTPGVMGEPRTYGMNLSYKF
jgi:iron complex outermembrane recepter protein